MLSQGKNKLGILFAMLAIFCLQITFSGNILSKGQMIKQFYAHSITTSLAQNGFKPFDTSLPCPSDSSSISRPWAEEPPVFHSIAAFGERLGMPQPAVVPILSGIALLLLLALWAQCVNPAQAFWLFALSALSPCFMRYFDQHLPDLFGTVWLIAGALLMVKNHRGWAWLCLMLAITSKATTIFAAGAILASDVFAPSLKKHMRFRKALIAILLSAAATLPFLIWLRALSHYEVPNPFAFKSVVENRHSGSWVLLASTHYWGRFFTWIAVVGVGIPLFVFSLLRLARVFQPSEWRRAPKAEQTLALWALAIVPHWIFLRAGNYTHDYYSLPFILPFALLGALEILRLKNLLLKVSLIAWSLAWGCLQPWKLAKGAREGAPPSFCDSEHH